MHAAGLKYVVYTWLHFPPTWLREKPADRTLMRCLEHGQETNYLSIFDPRTIAAYDHFYKNLHDHFGDRIDDVYACILGPYGEGNYPLHVPHWVNMGHCHEGWWCGDEFATRAFAAAMRSKYGDIDKLNAAWGASLSRFEDVRPPTKLSDEKFKPTPSAFATPQARRRVARFLDVVSPGADRFQRAIGANGPEIFPKGKSPPQARRNVTRHQPDHLRYLLARLREDGRQIRNRAPAGGQHRRPLRR